MRRISRKSGGALLLSLLLGLGVTASLLASSSPSTPLEAVDSSSSESTEATTVKDELTTTVLGLTSTYADFSGKKVEGHTAIYAGYAKTYSSTNIQMNTSSGIYSSVSGGILKSVTVNWTSYTYTSTDKSRTINIFASTTAFTGLSDLADTVKIGTVSYTNDGTTETSTETTYTVTEGTEYRYVGIKCNANTAYISSVVFEWEPVSEPTLELSPSSLSVDVSESAGSTVNVITNNLDGDLTFNIPTSDYYTITSSGSAGSYSLNVVGKAEMPATDITISVADSSGATASATLNLTVTQYATTTFTKASSLEIGGSYVLGYEDTSGNATLVGLKSGSHLLAGLAGTVSENTLTVLGDMSSTTIWTLSYGLESGQYSLWSETEDQFLGRGSNGVTEPSSVTTAASFNITFGESGNVVITNPSFTDDQNALRYSISQDYFTFYASNEDIYLYKAATASESYTNATNFANSLLTATSSPCNATGEGTDTESLATAWSTLSTSYEALNQVAKDLISKASAYSSFSEGDDAIRKALFLYDMIVSKYSSVSGISDFMGRTTSTTNALYGSFLSAGEDSSTLLVVGLIASLTILGGSAYFFRKRRIGKED